MGLSDENIQRLEELIRSLLAQEEELLQVFNAIPGNQKDLPEVDTAAEAAISVVEGMKAIILSRGVPPTIASAGIPVSPPQSKIYSFDEIMAAFHSAIIWHIQGGIVSTEAMEIVLNGVLVNLPNLWQMSAEGLKQEYNIDLINAQKICMLMQRGYQEPDLSLLGQIPLALFHHQQEMPPLKNGSLLEEFYVKIFTEPDVRKIRVVNMLVRMNIHPIALAFSLVYPVQKGEVRNWGDNAQKIISNGMLQWLGLKEDLSM